MKYLCICLLPQISVFLTELETKNVSKELKFRLKEVGKYIDELKREGNK